MATVREHRPQLSIGFKAENVAWVRPQRLLNVTLSTQGIKRLKNPFLRKKILRKRVFIFKKDDLILFDGQ